MLIILSYVTIILSLGNILYIGQSIFFFLNLLILDLPKHELLRKLMQFFLLKKKRLMQFFYIPLYSLVKLFNMSLLLKKKGQFHIETFFLKLSSLISL